MKDDKPKFEKRELSAEEKAIRKLAAEQGITPAAAAALIRYEAHKAQGSPTPPLPDSPTPPPIPNG